MWARNLVTLVIPHSRQERLQKIENITIHLDRNRVFCLVNLVLHPKISAYRLSGFPQYRYRPYRPNAIPVGPYCTIQNLGKSREKRSEGYLYGTKIIGIVICP